ncbi:MAG: zinc ABC transporter substrate-binding protein [Candidatus Nanopelagicales bacterium]
MDFPSKWLSERVGGDAVEVLSIGASEVAQTDADLLVYVPGLDAQVDAAAAELPQDRVINATGDVNLVASPRDPQIRDPYVWFDPVNVGTMAQTVADGLTSASPTTLRGVAVLRIARPIGPQRSARRRPAPAGDVQSVPDTDAGR